MGLTKSNFNNGKRNVSKHSYISVATKDVPLLFPSIKTLVSRSPNTWAWFSSVRDIALCQLVMVLFDFCS